MAQDIDWSQPPSEQTDPPAAAPNTTDDGIDWSKPPEESTSKLELSVQEAQKTPPDTAARVLKLQTQTGLDPDLIGRNLDEIEKQANSKGFDATAFQRDSPIVSEWMAEHPTKAAIAQPDTGPLSAVEGFFKRDLADPFMREMDAQKRWVLAEKAMEGTITPEDRDQIAEIDKRIASRTPEGPQNFVDSTLQNWVGNVPGLGRTLWEGAKGAAIGAVAGAVAGEGVGAVPGAGVGFPAGMAIYMARQEQANTYLELEKQGVSRPVALGAAMTSGTMTGILMALTGGASSKVAVPALSALQREGLQTLLSNPTTGMAIKGYLADIGKQMGIMGAFSGSSAMVHAGTATVAKMVDDGSIHAMTPMAILSKVFSPENLAIASEATKSGMVGGVGLGLAPIALEKIGDLHSKLFHANDAIERGKAIENAGKNLAETKVLQEAPNHAEELVSRMTKDTPNEHAYIPMAAWNEYWMKKEVDPRAAWESAAGHTESYDEAQRTGADLQLPMSKYMTTIGSSEHGKFFAQEVRTDPVGMNAREGEEFAKSAVKEVDQKATVVPETEPLTPAQQIIQKARQQQGLEDFFPDPKKVGMTDEQAVAFTKAEASARDQAEKEVSDKLMRKAEKVRQDLLGEKRVEIEKQVAEQVDARKDQFARSFLINGTEPDGTPVVSPFKLLRSAVKEDFSDMDMKNIPSKVFTADKNLGIHPDEAAPFLGFSSGEELIQALNKSEDRKAMIDRLTSGFMAGEGEIVSQPQMADAAMQAVHNDARAQVLQKGLKYMLSDNFAQAMGLVRRLTRRLPSIEEIRNQADSIIDAKKFRDTHPLLYQREISKATREAGIHFTNGDFDSMFESKQRELLNHELFRAASDAKEEINDRVANVAKYSTDKWQEKIGKAGGQYLEQLNSILERFDFKKSVSLADLDKRQDLRAWVEEQKAQGYDPDIPDKVLNDAYRKSYKDMANGDVKQVLDSIDTITHLANLKNKLIAGLEEREFDTVKSTLINQLDKNFDISDKTIVPRRVNESNLLPESIAYQTRMEFLFRHADGGEAVGPFWRELFKPTVDAENAEREMTKTKMSDLDNIFNRYPQSERAQWYLHKTFIPEIGTSLLKPNILMAALNLGNEYNRGALMEGYKWTEAQLDAVTKHLDSKDWETVQKIWDHLETYRHDIGALEKKLNGREPEWVDSSPFTVNSSDGKTINMRGGYFPILFDKKLSWFQGMAKSEGSVQEMFGGNPARAMTKTGHTESRIGTCGKPLSLQFTGLMSHITDVIHDLTHREAVIDIRKLISDPEIRDGLKKSIGDADVSQLNPWLKRIAGVGSNDPYNPYESLLNSARGGATIANLGLKVTSALVHTTNFAMAANELGPKYTAKAITEFYANPLKSWEMIKEKDPSMAAMTENMDRDIRDKLKSMNIIGTREGVLSVADAYTHNLQKALFAHYGMVYTTVAGPAWLGGYMKAMDGEIPNIKAGDERGAIDYAGNVVRTRIASASAKDIPNILGRQGLMKLFTMYMGPLNLVFNNMKEGVQDFKMHGDAGKLAATTATVWFSQAILQELIRGRTPHDEESMIEWASKAIAKMPFETIVGGRAVMQAFTSRGHDLSVSPVFDAMQSMIRGTAALKDRAIGDKDELSRTEMKDVAMTAGYFTGLPTRQALATTEYVYDWLSGKEQPDSIPEGLIRSLIGKKH